MKFKQIFCTMLSISLVYGSTLISFASPKIINEKINYDVCSSINTKSTKVRTGILNKIYNSDGSLRGITVREFVTSYGTTKDWMPNYYLPVTYNVDGVSISGKIRLEKFTTELVESGQFKGMYKYTISYYDTIKIGNW